MPAGNVMLFDPAHSLPGDAYALGTRQMVGLSRSLSSSHASVGALSHQHHHHQQQSHSHSHGHGQHPYLDAAPAYHRAYAGGALHPSAHVASAGAYLGVPGPLSAPPALPAQSTQAFLGGGGIGYGGYGAGGARERYGAYEHAHSVSPGPGSGYTTPH